MEKSIGEKESLWEKMNFDFLIKNKVKIIKLKKTLKSRLQSSANPPLAQLVKMK
jgi:hypothetical protein